VWREQEVSKAVASVVRQAIPYQPDEIVAKFNARTLVMPPNRKIVCLCGSTRFGDAFAKANLEETLAGNIVLSVGCYTHSDEQLVSCVRCNKSGNREAVSAEPCALSPNKMHSFTTGLSVVVKQKLDELHKVKIAMADEVLVLNVEMCVRCKLSRAKWEEDHKRNSADYCVGGYQDPQGSQHQWQPYIGESTKSEIEYAKKIGKPIRYLNHIDPELLEKTLKR
jgi:hypothetical protein